MGYCADGGGLLTLKPNTNVGELNDKLANGSGALSYQVYGNEIEFWCEDKYYEDGVYEDLEIVKPYIVSGELEFTGEDNAVWRICFNPDTQEWIEENGTIVYGFESYTDGDLIAELQKRGYVVRKNELDNLLSDIKIN